MVNKLTYTWIITVNFFIIAFTPCLWKCPLKGAEDNNQHTNWLHCVHITLRYKLNAEESPNNSYMQYLLCNCLMVNIKCSCAEIHLGQFLYSVPVREMVKSIESQPSSKPLTSPRFSKLWFTKLTTSELWSKWSVCVLYLVGPSSGPAMYTETCPVECVG
jgi:hypothetical protein